MKRPERPVARPAAPAPAASPRTPKAPKPERTPKPERAARPERVAKAERAPRVERVAKPVPLRATREERRREPRPEPERRPVSERRADRLRRRAEKAQARRFTRATRRRRVGRLVVLSVLGVVGVLIAVAVFSPILALRQVRVEGTERLDPEVVAEAVSGQLGTPLALLDEERIRRELGAFPVIRSFATELVPPDTLVIHLVERDPIGVVATADGFDVVDAAGVVIETVPGRPDKLPLFQLGDDGVDSPAFAAMAEVLLALPRSVLVDLDSISARTRDDVTLRFAGSDQRVVWGGPEDSERKALILEALLDRFADRGPGEYDVSAPGSAVFRED